MPAHFLLAGLLRTCIGCSLVLLAWCCTPLARCAELPANRLIDSNNPYLLLHAHNPVDWYPWGAEALDKARRENKPIFLSIGYSTCYWCHVAERTLFANPQIAQLMNQWFINIKVDREERPDIDAVYMLATQLITAGGGGWPNNLFLTPDLAPFYAGGYWPPEDDELGRPGFPTILRNLHQEWEEHPDRLRARAQSLVSVLKQHEAKLLAASGDTPDPARWLKQTRESILRRFDAQYGGLSTARQATKFPESPALALMLLAYRKTGDPETLRFVTVTLDAMAYGGIYDQLGGGFHRYSTERTWSIPHFEKMLYDNAQLLSIYAQAWELTGRPQYRRIALGVRDYLLGPMTSPGEGFYTAQDAAVDGHEGASYIWTRAQISQLLGAQTQAFFETYAPTPLEQEDSELDAEDAPGVLRVKLNGSDAEREARIAALAPARRVLLAARNARAQAPIDEKILTGWNALAIDALVESARIFESDADLDLAQRAAQRLWRSSWDDNAGRLRHASYRDRVQGEGFLDDYALFVRALLALHQATGEHVWLARARRVGDAMLQQFADTGAGTLHTTVAAQTLIVAPLEQGDTSYPSGTAAAVDALLRLFDATHSARYREAAARIARRLSGQPDAWPVAVAALNSVAVTFSPPVPSNRAGALMPVNDTAAHVHASAIVHARSGVSEIAIVLEIDPGYHINANPASYDYLIPTRLRLPGVPASRIVYPQPTLFKPSFAPEGVRVYSGKVQLVAQMDETMLAHASALRAVVEAQACTQTVCLPPAKIAVVVRIGEKRKE